MADEKNFLHSIKLEISRNFKLVPYERIAFHKILGILKTDMDLAILLNDLEKGEDIRASAVAKLVKFSKPEIISKLAPLLERDISELEKIQILDFIEKHGNESNILLIVDFIKSKMDTDESKVVLSKAFNVLRHIGVNSDEALSFLISVVNLREIDQSFITMAIYALSSFRVISSFEELLKFNDDEINYSIFKALYTLSCDLIDSEAKDADEEDKLFTYSQADEDKIILDIRVFLGKVAAGFDNFSNKTKISFISAMISSNHREFLSFIMKALTSKEPELVTMSLYTIFHNINRLKDPDKLFRNLISLSTESERDDELIIEIFHKFFSIPRKSRQFNILKDKLYSYIVVTVETYFETFRKNFMITDVIEKSYPESFQLVRKFILEKFTPDLKAEILNFLKNENPSSIRQIINDLSMWISNVSPDDSRDLFNFYEILFDADKKSRLNSASRFEDINFEKRYLENRIIRLCHLMEKLKINDGASALVNIYNYLKKYPDIKIMDAVIHTLSVLNYSYMLGEIEVQLSTGSHEDQIVAMKLLSLFYEQRSLNILIEFIKTNKENEFEIMIFAINNLIDRDIFGNVSAQALLKEIITINRNPKVKSRAILCLGKCGFDSDIAYLNDLFYSTKDDDSKDIIVLSIGYIVSLNKNFKRRELIKYLQEYLKDPGIKVRIYSCLLLAKLGSKDAFKSIKDMLIIKNKTIQRVILVILGELKSIELTFFFISLLNEEYGISRDIIPIIEMLPEPDLKEIDSFIINLFQKFETPTIEDVESGKKQDPSAIDLVIDKVYILKINLSRNKEISTNMSIPDLISLNLKVRGLVADVLFEHNGIITRMSNNEIITIFSDPIKATNAAKKIANNYINYNRYKIVDKHIKMNIQLIADDAKLIKDELFSFSEYKFFDLTGLPLFNKIVVNEEFAKQITGKFSFKKIPEIINPGIGVFFSQFEIIDQINFAEVSNEILDKIVAEDEKKQEIQLQIADELKKIKRENRSTSAIAIAKDLDDIGIKLKKQLNEIERYVQRRSTDREMIGNVKKMLTNIYNLYKVEISRIIVE